MIKYTRSKQGCFDLAYLIKTWVGEDEAISLTQLTLTGYSILH